MLSLLRRNFYWPQMEQVVQHYTQNCPRCTLHKARANVKAPLVPLTPKAPMHIVAMDFLTLGRPTDRYQNILVVTDLFTKYAWAIPTPDQTALTTARALWAHVIQPFGCPETFHSDQGPNFESKLVKELCKVYGCRKTHTTPYHPQGNGACERFNQTLLSLLGTLEVEQHSQWVGHLLGLIQSYNNTVHSSTSYAPSFLMFGRHFRTPMDMMTGTAGPDNTNTTTEWVGRHHTQLHYAYDKVTAHLHKAARKNKRLYDRTAKDAPLLPGEHVLALDQRRQGKGKLSDRRENQPYVVIKQPYPDRPVYTIWPEGKAGPERVLHRNNLRPCLPALAPRPEDDAKLRNQGSNEDRTVWGFALPLPLHPEGVAQEAEGPAVRRSQREHRRMPARYRN